MSKITGYPPQEPGGTESIIDSRVATHAAITATHGVGEVADAVDLTTHEADTSTHGVGEVADAADLTTHIADTSTHGVTGDILGTEDKDVANGVLGLGPDLSIGHAFEKVASANLRNSHDAEVTASTSSKVYQTKKTVTFLNGLRGQINIKFDKKRSAGADWCYARVLKNETNVLVAEQQFANAVYDTVSTDVTEDFVPGDTIDLQICTDAGASTVNARNFRFYYDNVEFVTVPGVNS